MNGEKPLSISWHDGEYWWGYTAYGIDRDVIKYLHCGQDISGGLFSVDEEFSDGDIEKMKAHYEEVEKSCARKKKKRAKSVDNTKKKKQNYLMAFSGKSRSILMETRAEEQNLTSTQ